MQKQKTVKKRLLEVTGHSLERGEFQEVGYVIDSTPHSIFLCSAFVEGKPSAARRNPIAKKDIKAVRNLTARTSFLNVEDFLANV